MFEKRRLSSHLVESLQQAKILRENADYYDDWSQTAAESLLKSAEEFLNVAERVAAA